MFRFTIYINGKGELKKKTHDGFADKAPNKLHG